MTVTERPWSVPVRVEDIPDTGQHVDLTADAEARTALARLANLRDLPELTASFDLNRRGAGVHVSGRVKARVGQTCVVTLEPIENTIDEAVDLVFSPAVAAVADTGEAEVSPIKTGKEPPEPLVGGVVDLGAVATEFLLLGIDPYPRKPGAEFTATTAGDHAAAHPFAALAALKKGPGGKEE